MSSFVLQAKSQLALSWFSAAFFFGVGSPPGQLRNPTPGADRPSRKKDGWRPPAASHNPTPPAKKQTTTEEEALGGQKNSNQGSKARGGTKKSSDRRSQLFLKKFLSQWLYADNLRGVTITPLRFPQPLRRLGQNDRARFVRQP